MAETEISSRRGTRWGRIVGGVVIVLVGALAALASFGAIILTSCEADELSSGAIYQARSKGVAVVVPSTVLELEGPWSPGFFCGADYSHLTVEAEAQGADGKRVFMGTVSPAAARRYFNTALYTRAWATGDFVDLSASLDVPIGTVGRDIRPVDPPAAQRFWLGRAEPIAASASRLRRSWQDASFEEEISAPFWLVLVNEDGSPGVAAELRLHIEVPGPRQWPYVGVMIAGALTLIGGVALARSGRRTARRASMRDA